jgi:RNA polymerase sigma-70 factor (ECF subfamily)
VIDADLLRRALNGDADAVNALLTDQREFLLALARGRIGPQLQARVDASDIVQQTCLSVFRQLDEFRGEDPAQFVAWLRQIHERNIQNVVQAHAGTRKRAVDREQVVETWGDVAEQRPTASHDAMLREEQHRLAAALADIPSEERFILELRYFEGKTLAEIAELAGLSKEAVIWRMQKGMQHVRAVLRDPPS